MEVAQHHAQGIPLGSSAIIANKTTGQGWKSCSNNFFKTVSRFFDDLQ
jgi:hypothetical protein